jgi:hypothetical protein
MHTRRQAVTRVDILLRACAENPNVLRYVHSDRYAWTPLLYRYVAHTPAPRRFHSIRSQWGATLSLAVDPDLLLEDVFAIIRQNVSLIEGGDTIGLFPEEERRRNLAAYYDQVVRAAGRPPAKRMRSASPPPR